MFSAAGCSQAFLHVPSSTPQSPFSQGTFTAEEGTTVHQSPPPPCCDSQGPGPRCRNHRDLLQPCQAQSDPPHPQGRRAEEIIIHVSVYVCGDEWHLADHRSPKSAGGWVYLPRQPAQAWSSPWCCLPPEPFCPQTRPASQGGGVGDTPALLKALG